jgi:hypothetical protein
LPLHPLRRYIFYLFRKEVVYLQSITAKDSFLEMAFFETLHAATTRYIRANSNSKWQLAIGQKPSSKTLLEPYSGRPNLGHFLNP